jgi:hypothetical protein
MAKKPPPPKDNPFAGLTTCLRCDRKFDSWDRRHNRICPSCKEELAERPSPEPSYRVSKRHITRDDEEHGDQLAASVAKPCLCEVP